MHSALLSEISYHAKELLVGRNQLTLSFVLSFPVLERLLKIKCGEFVRLDGKVRQQFQLDFHPYDVGKKVSSLAILLSLYEQKVASLSMKDLLAGFKTEVEGLFPEEENDCYQLIYKWRNNTLHGENMQSHNYAVVINLICLLLLDSLQPQYETLLKNVKFDFEQRREMGRDSFAWPWTIFPPDQLAGVR